MHIVFHAHHADVTDALQQKAQAAVEKVAGRLRGTTDASIRFAEDGAQRRVELVLRIARRAPLVAEATAPRYEAALSTAVERLETHVAHVKALRARRRAQPRPTGLPFVVGDEGTDEFEPRAATGT